MLKNRKLDHLVYAVPNLEKAMEDFENMTGITPIFGGYHTTQGTKNALVNLGNQAYLEMLAIDDKNTEISAPRWMGIDFTENPMLTRWALKSKNLKTDAEVVKNYHTAMDKIQGGQRKTDGGQLLKWSMIMPLASPKVELIPFFCDWQHSAVHPTDALPEQAKIVEVILTHPVPNLVIPTLNKLSINLEIAHSKSMSIRAMIETSKGIFTI